MLQCKKKTKQLNFVNHYKNTSLCKYLFNEQNKFTHIFKQNQIKIYLYSNYFFIYSNLKIKIIYFKFINKNFISSFQYLINSI